MRRRGPRADHPTGGGLRRRADRCAGPRPVGPGRRGDRGHRPPPDDGLRDPNSPPENRPLTALGVDPGGLRRREPGAHRRRRLAGRPERRRHRRPPGLGEPAAGRAVRAGLRRWGAGVAARRRGRHRRLDPRRPAPATIRGAGTRPLGAHLHGVRAGPDRSSNRSTDRRRARVGGRGGPRRGPPRLALHAATDRCLGRLRSRRGGRHVADGRRRPDGRPAADPVGRCDPEAGRLAGHGRIRPGGADRCTARRGCRVRRSAEHPCRPRRAGRRTGRSGGAAVRGRRGGGVVGLCLSLAVLASALPTWRSLRDRPARSPVGAAG